ncbi:MAG: class I tRNA ligase family protein, partial [Candidatus Shikimatogenerans sp. JK-2022]|nr:class I tRNA ligase family protein [Candidatus Shikimatogenerans bostrichidophilus]
LLVTGYDILFFWVLRMIMFSIYYTKFIPFKKIYFIGIARDKKRKKISKSLGNYKKLYYLLNKYGADGIRVGLLNNSNENDFIFEEVLCKNGRNFINKLWNSFKVIKKIKQFKKKRKIKPKEKKVNKIIIIWFKYLLNYNIYKLNFLLKNFKIYKSFILVKNIIKNKFCSILLELIKNKKQINIKFKLKILKYYNILLKILHPYAPFITEYIWNILNKKKKDITISSWPTFKKKIKKQRIKKFNYTLNFIKFLKKIKFKKKKIYIYIKSKNIEKFKKKFYILLIYKYTLIKNIKLIKKNRKFIYFYYNNNKIFFKRKNIKINKNKKNIKKKIKFYINYLKQIKTKLNNKKFLLLAPKKIINLERKKKKDIKKKILNLKINFI